MINHIQIPADYIQIASGWYCGVNDMLYAITSTGNLTLGSIRPYDSDEKCYLAIWRELSIDVARARRTAEKNGHEDYLMLKEFEEYVDDMCSQLAANYGLEDWDEDDG